MRGRSTEWFERWTIKYLSSRGLPCGGTHFLSTSTWPMPGEIEELVRRGDTGLAIVCFFVDEHCWTLLGDDAIVARCADNRIRIAIDDIEGVVVLDHPEIEPKRNTEFVVIKDVHGSVHKLYAPKGAECMALAGLLITLDRIRKRGTLGHG